jgi:hypothetical protein
MNCFQVQGSLQGVRITFGGLCDLLVFIKTPLKALKRKAGIENRVGFSIPAKKGKYERSFFIL